MSTNEAQFIHNIETVVIKPFRGTIPTSHQIIISYREDDVLKQIILCMDETQVLKLGEEIKSLNASFVHESNPMDYIK